MASDSRRPTGRVWNFGAGPATLPEAVIHQVRDELPGWQDSGMSVMEMSHRGGHFRGIAERAEEDLRELLDIPDDYRVLFLQGGATLQFAMVPLNLLRGGDRADYLRTGAWSQKAVAEAQRHCSVNLAVDTRDTGYRDLPPKRDWSFDPGAAYVHYTPNETINGVEFHEVPETSGVPLVADASSTILSRRLDVRRYGILYAGAQKNIGPAGLTVVIIDDDLVGHASPGVPGTLDYANHAGAGSMYNTPPAFAWYVAGLVFRWLLEQGGVDAIGRVNERKAGKLYAAIDASGFYDNPVAPSCRSRMNIPFTLADPALDSRFIDEAAVEGLINLAGHRSVGGMRASLYNAMPEAGVDALVDFMASFEKRHG